MQNYSQNGLACRRGSITLTIKDMKEIKQNDPGMFGTMQAYMQSEVIDIRLENSRGALVGVFEQYFRVRDGKVRTRLVKGASNNKALWEIYKQHKESYPMKDVDREDYDSYVKNYMKNGMSRFEAEQVAEDVLPGTPTNWRSFFKIIKIYWDNILEI